MQPIVRFLAGLSFIIFCSVESRAQCDSVALAPDSLQWVTDAKVHVVKKYNDTLYIGGEFLYLGKFAGSFAGFNATTGKMYKPRTWPRANGNVREVISDNNGGFFLLGTFSKIGDSVRSEIAHIDTAGNVRPISLSVDDSLTSGMVHNGILYLGGSFTMIGGKYRAFMAAYDIAGDSITNWSPSPNNRVTLFATDGQRLYIGGWFDRVGSTTTVRNHLASFDLATGNLTTWAPSLSNIPDDMIVHNNKVYVCGGWSNLAGAARANIGAVDKITGAITPWNPGTSSRVYEMVLRDNKMYIFGQFTTAGGQSRNGMAAIDTATGIPTSWNPGKNNFVYCADAIGDKIYAGGNFTTAAGQSVNGIVAIDTSTGQIPATFYASTAAGEVVRSMVVVDTNVFIGGTFSSIDMRYRKKLAAINLSSNTIHPLSHNVQDEVYCIAFDNNIMYIGGWLNSVNNSNRTKAAAFDIATNYSLTPWNPLATGTITANSVNDIVPHGDYMYIGGQFRISNNGTHEHTMRIGRTSAAVDAWAPATSLSSSNRTNRIIPKGNLLFLGGNYQIPPSGRYGLLKIDSASGNIISNFTRSNLDRNWIDIDNNNKIFCAADRSGTSNYSGMAYDINTHAEITAWDPDPNYGGFDRVVLHRSAAFVTGDFQHFNGNTWVRRHGIAALDTVTGATLSGFKPAIEGAYCMEFAGDTLFVGGEFTRVGKFELFTTLDASGKKIGGLARFHLNYNNTPTISISTPKDTVCAGTEVVVTCNTTATGGTYQWKKNGTNVGTNSSTYTFTPANNDTVTCTVTISPYDCYMLTSVSSGIIDFTLTPNVPAGDTVVASANNVCAGTSVTFTANTNVPGATYIWKVGTTSVGSNSPTYAYAPANNDVVSCTVVAPAGVCYTPDTLTDDTVMIVIANTAPTISFTASDDSVCAGDTVHYTAGSNMTGGSYQWRVGSTNVATGSTYSYPPANSDVVRCVVTKATGTCYAPDTIARDTTMTVFPNVVPVITITATADSVCPGKADTFTATTNVTGGSYQWLVNGSTAGTNINTYIYQPANNDVVECVIDAGSAPGCYLPDEDTSNAVTITHTSSVVPSVTISVSPDTVICAGTSLTFTAVPTNGGTNPVYQWYRNGSPVSGATQNPYSGTGWQNNDVITCEMSSTATCPIPDKDTSDGITIHVTPVTTPTVSISANPGTTISQGTMVTFTATATDIGTSTAYQWYINSGAIVGAVNSTYMSNALADMDQVTATAYSNDSCSNPDSAVSNVLTMTVTSSVSEIEAGSNTRIYPNPVSNMLTIVSDRDIRRVEVLNLYGQKLIVKEGSGKTEEIDMRSFVPGVYIIKVNDGGFVSRVVKE